MSAKLFLLSRLMHDSVDLIWIPTWRLVFIVYGQEELLHLSLQVVFSKPWLSIDARHLGIVRTETGKDGRVVVILSLQVGGIFYLHR
jgi:hypothetical protein